MSRHLVDNVPLPLGTRAYPIVDGRVLWREPVGLYAMRWPVVDYSWDERGGGLTIRETGYLTRQKPREFVVLDEDLPEGVTLYEERS